MADRLPFSGEQYWNAISRNAFPGAKLYTYTSLSRTLLKETFTDAGAGTPHSNPVIADANGLFDAIYGNGEYFIDIYNTDDTILIYQEDEVFGAGGSGLDNITTTVSLIADLRVVDTTTFQSAFVEGETAINDGGQGRFYFDATSVAIDNGTTIIAPTVGSGRWLILKTFALVDDSVITSKVTDGNITNIKLSDMDEATMKGREVGAGTGLPVDMTRGAIAAVLAMTGNISASGSDSTIHIPVAGGADLIKIILMRRTLPISTPTSLVTFTSAFSETPYVFISQTGASSGSIVFPVGAFTPTLTNVTTKRQTADAGVSAMDVFVIAIGKA